MYLVVTITATALILLPVCIWSACKRTRASQGVAMATMVTLTIINGCATSYAIMEGIL